MYTKLLYCYLYICHITDNSITRWVQKHSLSWTFTRFQHNSQRRSWRQRCGRHGHFQRGHGHSGGRAVQKPTAVHISRSRGRRCLPQGTYDINKTRGNTVLTTFLTTLRLYAGFGRNGEPLYFNKNQRELGLG